MGKIKFIINCLLSLLLSIFIGCILLVILLHNIILNKNYIISSMHDVKFYEQMANEIESTFDNYKYQSGLPEETLQNLYSADLIEKDVSSVVDYIYGGTEYSNSSSIVKNNLDSKINEYIETQNIKLNEQGKENIKVYEDLIEKEYNNTINSSSLIYKSLRGTINSIASFYNSIKYYVIGFSILIFLLLIIINIKNLLNAINYIGISSLTSGLIILISTFYISSKIQLDNIVLFSKALTSLSINMYRELLFMIKDIGTLLIFCGVVSILISNILNKYDIESGK